MTQVERIEGGLFKQPVSKNPVRTAVRFPIRLPLTIYTEAGAFSAITENVSANGVLFTCEYLPELDSRIEFTMAMPAAIMGADKDVSIHCVGRIVRHDLTGNEKKAAVVIDEYSLKA